MDKYDLLLTSKEHRLCGGYDPRKQGAVSVVDIYNIQDNIAQAQLKKVVGEIDIVGFYDSPCGKRCPCVPEDIWRQVREIAGVK